MATDGPDPTPCDLTIFQEGESIFVTHGISSNRMERWVKEVAKASGQPVDWHFFGGRANILAIGDLSAVRRAIDDLMPLHDQLRKETTDAYQQSENANDKAM